MPTTIVQQFEKEQEEMLSRRQARCLALQVLFCNEFLHEDIVSVANRVADSLEQEINDFSRELILKTDQNKEDLDLLILQHLRNWKLERVARLDRVLIRMALAEILYFRDIPVEVTINEALEISKMFSNSKSSRFINGILDNIYKRLEKEHKIHKNLIARIPPSSKKKREYH